MRRRYGLAVLWLLLVGVGARLEAEPSAGEGRYAPLVLVVTQTMREIKVGNGFAVGDGSLVVTASHTVFQLSGQGQHRMPGSPTVFSPYLGDVSAAEIVAVDTRLDLAVLRTRWPGHPAFRVADTETLLAADRLEVLGLPGVLFNITRVTEVPREELLRPGREVLPLDFVALRQGQPWLLTLAEVGELKPGWSGAAMVVPDTDVVAGCFTELSRRQYGLEPATMVAQGPAVSPVSGLLAKKGLTQALRPATRPRPRPADAEEAFLASLRMLSHLIKDDPTPALASAQAFSRFRPDSAFGYRVSAYAAAKLDRPDLAETLYRKALEKDPEEPSTRLRYVQFLGRHGRREEALTRLEALWETGKMRPQAALFFHNLLARQGALARCAQLTRQALQENPRNAYLWSNLGTSLARSGDLPGALASHQQAARLWPERRRFTLLYVQALERLGRYRPAERELRRLVRTHPEDPLLHFRLAIFLASHRPEALQEAIQEAQTASRLPPSRLLPAQIIQRFIEAVSQGTFSEAEELLSPTPSPHGAPGEQLQP